MGWRALAAAVMTGMLVSVATGCAVTAPAGTTGTSGDSTSGASAPVTRTPAPAPPVPPSISTPPAPPSCAAVAAKLPRDAQIAQLFMAGLSATSSPAAGAAAVKAAGVGSVVLLSNSRAGVVVTGQLSDALQAAVPDLLIATDQEGGQVQRLQGTGFDRIPTAVVQADLEPADLQLAAARWGAQLREAGVRYNLAPVADVVPASKVRSNAPIGQLDRGYGADAEHVAQLVDAFIRGMAASGVATSAKHFPTLGQVTGNTDFTPASDKVTTRTSSDLGPFRSGVADAHIGSVMVSSATYELIDPGVPAVFSSIIVTDMLRGDLGFRGVIISDDLGAAKSIAHVPTGERATRFFAAGGDLLINADATAMPAMKKAVADKADADTAFAVNITASAGRVLALKASVGLGSCSG